MKKYLCKICHWDYLENRGDKGGGIQPGTSFIDIPQDWVCPICGHGKENFICVSELEAERNLYGIPP